MIEYSSTPVVALALYVPGQSWAAGQARVTPEGWGGLGRDVGDMGGQRDVGYMRGTYVMDLWVPLRSSGTSWTFRYLLELNILL